MTTDFNGHFSFHHAVLLGVRYFIYRCLPVPQARTFFLFKHHYFMHWNLHTLCHCSLSEC